MQYTVFEERLLAEIKENRKATAYVTGKLARRIDRLNLSIVFFGIATIILLMKISTI